jgi:L-threonylcarbamoyladenylate synthase
MVILDALSDPKLIELLKAGKVGVIPTDTIYGLACRATDGEAVKKLYALKSRENKPGTVIAANIQQIIDLGIPARYVKAVEQFWPNPISVELPHDLTYLNQSTGRQAFRVVADNELRKFLEQTGALLTSSANQPGEPPANTILEAQKYFGDSVDFYVDGGDLSGREPSTLIRIIDDAVEVIREGAVKVNEAGEIES